VKFCAGCGHADSQHISGSRCEVRVLSDWSDEAGQYTGWRRCTCQGFRAIVCPHEFLEQGGCVFCGAARVGH
jgi:hypothetical protein